MKIGVDVAKIEAALNTTTDGLKSVAEQLPKNPSPPQVDAAILAAEKFLEAERESVLFTVVHEAGHGLDWEFSWTTKPGPDPGEEEALNKLAAQVVGELENIGRGRDPLQRNPFIKPPEEMGRPTTPKRKDVYIPPPPGSGGKPDPRQLLGGEGAVKPHKSNLAGASTRQ